MIFTHILTQYACIFSSPLKKNSIFLPFYDVLVKRDSRRGSITTHSLLSTTIYNPRTPTNIIITRHVTQNNRSSLLPKLYSAGFTLTSQIKHRSTVNYRVYAIPCSLTKWVSYQNHFSYFQTAMISEYTIQSLHFYSLHTRRIGKGQKICRRDRGESCYEIRLYHWRNFTFIEESTRP